MHPQRVEDGLGHQQGVVDRCQRDQPGAIGEPAGHFRRRPQCQPGLADASAAGQGQQAGGGQQPLEFAKLLPAPDKARQLGRQVRQLPPEGSIPHLRASVRRA
jgi:hypothetical protein